MTSRTTSAALLFASSLLFLPACSASANTTPNLMPAANNLTATGAQPQDRQGCSNGGDLHVTPCRITFDTGNPGPVTVNVTHDGDRRNDGGNGHAIQERDNCASRNVATIARNSTHVYTVTAGTATGSCTAVFSDNGNRNDDHGGRGQGGGSELRIVNKL